MCLTRLDEIRARAQYATDGPWTVDISFDRKWALIEHGGWLVARASDDDTAEFVVIHRDELPEVKAGAPKGWAECDEDLYSPELSPAMLRKDAFKQLAVAEWFEDGNSRRKKRRNELAKELTETGYGKGSSFPTYAVASAPLQAAIDRIIELEARA